MVIDIRVTNWQRSPSRERINGQEFALPFGPGNFCRGDQGRSIRILRLPRSANAVCLVALAGQSQVELELPDNRGFHE